MLSEKLENMADALEEERYATAAAAASSASRSFVAQAGAPSAKRTLRRDLITVPSITARAKKYKVFQKPDPRFIRDAIPTSYLCLLKVWVVGDLRRRQNAYRSNFWQMATSVAQCCIEELFYVSQSQSTGRCCSFLFADVLRPPLLQCVMMREKFLLQLRDGQQDVRCAVKSFFDGFTHRQSFFYQAPPPQIGVDGICPHCLAWERTYTARRKHRCKAARALGLRPLGLKAPAEIQPNAAADASDGAAEDENDSASENDDDNDGAATETTAKTRRKPRVDPEVVLEDIVNSDMLPTIAVWRRLCDRFF